MEEFDLGPNGGLVYCMEYLLSNFSWLEDKLKQLGSQYVLFDCPGQVSTPSLHYFITTLALFYHTFTLPLLHFTTLPHLHFTTSSLHYFTTSSLYHYLCKKRCPSSTSTSHLTKLHECCCCFFVYSFAIIILTVR